MDTSGVPPLMALITARTVSDVAVNALSRSGASSERKAARPSRTAERALAIELEIVRYSVSLRYESISELWEMRGQVRSAAIGESGGAEQWDNSRRRHNESHYLLDMSQFCCCAKERAPTLLPLWLS